MTNGVIGLQRLVDFLNTKTMIIVAGIFLIPSLIEHLEVIEGFAFPIIQLGTASLEMDPAWVTVFICGLPLAHLAITRVIRQMYISSALLITIAMVAAIYINELFRDQRREGKD